MKKSILSLIMLATAITAPQALTAAHLSPEQALSRALRTDRHRAISTNTDDYQLTFTASDAVYLFRANDGSSFMVLSADDAAPAVLGYSDGGSFDVVDMPPDMHWWLSEYARQINSLAASAPVYKASSADTKAPIEPLVKTLWNQGSPYNVQCPLIDGSRAVTGCVATAMAQVMNYHQWPAHGSGSNTYSSNGTTITLDFSSIAFDWDLMLNSYDAASSSDSKDAVAELMYACGVSVDMQYTTTESGTSDVYVPAALVNYFGYDEGVRYIPRDFYGLEAWQNLMYSQLRDYGPVQYSGQSSDGGHSFVCDGYSSDGYFHINWGWGGMSNGYFLLTALDPGEQGIGGSTSGYNFSQSIIANVSRPREGSEMYPNLLMEASFAITQKSAELGSTVTASGIAYNFSTGPVSGTLGLKTVNLGTGEATYSTGKALSGLAFLHGFATYTSSIPDNLSDGTYKVYPAFCSESGKWYDIPVKLGYSQAADMTVSNGTAYFSQEANASLKATDLDLESAIYMGQQFHLTATLSNPTETEFYGSIAPMLVNSAGTAVAIGQNYPVDILGGDSTTMDYIGSFTSYSSAGMPKSGTYTLYLVDSNTLNKISAGIDVPAYSAPSSTSITVSDFAFDGDSTAADPTDLKFTGIVDCTAGYFGGTLKIYIFPYSTQSVSSVASFSSQPVFVEAGNTAELDASGSFSNADYATKYMAAVFNGSNQVSDVALFTTKSGTSGLESHELASLRSETYYTLSGLEVPGADLTSGLYIVRRINSDGSVYTRKIVR